MKIRSDVKNNLDMLHILTRNLRSAGGRELFRRTGQLTDSQLIVQNLFFKDKESQTYPIEANLLTVDIMGEKIQVTIISDNSVVYQRRVGAVYIGDAEVCSVDLAISFQI